MSVASSRRDAWLIAGLVALYGAPIYVGSPLSPDLPLERAARLAFSAGQPPIWNPYFFGGQPLLANPVAGVFYPPLLLARLAPIESTLALLNVVHASVFIVGIYLVIRRLGETRLVAVLSVVAATMTVTLSTPLPSAWLARPAVAWLPLLMALTIESARRARRGPSIGLIAVLAVVFLSGSLRDALYAVAAIFGTAAFVAALLSPSRPRPSSLLIACAGAVGIAAGLSAFQSIPQADVSSQLASGELIEAVPDATIRAVEPDPVWRGLLSTLRGHVALSDCDRVRPSDLASAGVAVLDGVGPHSPDYARFTRLVSGLYPVPDDPTTALTSRSAARSDLLSWLGVEYLVTCHVPDSEKWTLVNRAGDVAVYRATTPTLAATWMCKPLAVSRGELEYALATHRYTGLRQAAPRPIVHVRWSERIEDAQRHRLETELRLIPLRFMGERTWQYELTDASTGNVQAIVLNPLVEDTAHINRHRFEAEPFPPVSSSDSAKREWLVGAAPCPSAQAIRSIRNRPYRGRTVVDVSAPQNDGVVVLPRTWFPGLKAWVDGKRAPLLRANLALTAVPVAAGNHRVEVEYWPDSQSYGVGVTGITLVAWVGTWWTSRPRQ